MKCETLLICLFVSTISSFSVGGGKMVECSPGSSCRVISSCPAMMVLLARVKTGHRKALDTLLASQCGFYKFMPKVCCPGGRGMEERMGPEANINGVDTTMADNIIELDTTPDNQPTKVIEENFSRLNHPKCGMRTTIGFQVTFGNSASSGQFPWMAALIYSRGSLSLPLCGASLISRSHLLTAAHCTSALEGFTLSSARLGQTDISGPARLPGMEMRIGSVVQHTEYRQNPVAEFDLALVKLVSSLRFSDHIRPICLVAPVEEGRGEELVVAGWGRTERRRSSPGSLQFTNLRSVGREECQEEYTRAVEEGRLGRAAAGLEILDNQVCARGSGGSDSCAGDSGGPLMARGEGRWILRGVVSYGTAGCDSSLPGVYTRVESFLHWIQKAVDTS